MTGRQTLRCKICRCFPDPGRKWVEKNVREAFSQDGFNSWKGELEKNKGFTAHNDSDKHNEVTRTQAVYVGQKHDIREVLPEEVRKSCSEGRHAMITVFDVAKRLARQGLPFRSHEASDEFFKQILSLIVRSGNSELKSWLSRKFDWTLENVSTKFCKFFIVKSS